MTDREKTMYVFLFCLALVIGWIFVIYAPLREQTQRTETLIGRKLNRTKTRARVPDAPTASAPKLIARLANLEDRRVRIEQEVLQREQGFVSLDTVYGIKELRLKIANLAESTGLDVLRFGQLRSDDGITDSANALRNQIQTPYGRPMLNMEAKGSYAEIFSFVRQINQMKWSASITWMMLTAPDFKTIERDPQAAGELTLRMEIAL